MDRCPRAGAVLAALLVASRIGAQAPPPSLATYLQQTIALKTDEMLAVSSGAPIVKVLDTPDQREIAIVGIVRIGVPRSFYVRLAADFPSSIRASSRLAFGILSEPASPANVARLSLPHDDVQDLARCRPGSCDVKLSAETISHLRATVDFTKPSADSIVTAFFRTRLLDYIAGYRARGDNALVVYDDQQSAVAAAQVLQGILTRSPAMYQYAPSLERYLENYPADRPPDISEVIFWAEDDLPGLKPTLTLTHRIVYAPPELPGSTLIASKMLYAAHFLDGALDLDAVVDEAASSGTTPTALYLVRFRRLHFDDLPSGGLLNVRGKAISKLRERTTTGLRDARAAAERAYADQ